MGFRVFIFTDSDLFYGALERAFETLSFSLVRSPIELLADPAALQVYLAENRAAVVINAMCWNKLPTESIAKATTALGIPLLHTSSYQVFGVHQKELDETTLPAPDDDYGRMLFALEQGVLTNPNAMVLRLPWLLLAGSESLLARICEGLLSGELIQVSEDCYGYVITLDEVARVTAAMIQQIIVGAENWGVFHVRSSDMCSEAEFTDVITRLLRAEGFENVQYSTYKGHSAFQPKTGMLHGRRCTDNFGIQFRSFRLGLKANLQQYLAHRALT